MKHTAFFLFFILGLPLSQAQQGSLFTLYRDAWSFVNPAALSNNYILNNRTMSLSGNGRFQWWGLPESPRTQTLQWEWMDEDHNSVWGGQLLNERTGKIGQTGVYGRYAYRIRKGRRVVQSLTIGVQAGAVQQRARWSEISFTDPTTAPQTDQWAIRPDVGLGVFYHYADRWYAGLSVPQTFGLRTKFNAEAQTYALRSVPHVYGVAGWYWNAPWLGNETSFIEPSIWIRYVPHAPLSIDLNARCQVSELVWFGTGASMGFGTNIAATLHAEAGLFFGEQVQLLNSQLKLGFGFDLPITQGVAGVFGAGGEITLVYAWR